MDGAPPATLDDRRTSGVNMSMEGESVQVQLRRAAARWSDVRVLEAVF
jgi:hypothetical protein